jgi:S-DNA-T family DNA segregation ATPase FtsK/SpoIIIE
MAPHSNLDKLARAIMRDNPGMSFLSARRAARRQRATATSPAANDELPNVVAHPGFGNRPPGGDPCRIPIGQSTDGEVFLDLSRQPGMLCGGLPGTGKTNLMMSILGHLAGHAEMLVFDGKNTHALDSLLRPCRFYGPDNLDALRAALTVLTQRMMASGARAQALAGAFGQRSFWDVPTAEREAHGLFPIVVAIDEAQPWFDPPLWAAEQDREEIITMIRSLITQGHALGIVVFLSMQKMDPVTVPGLIRDAIGVRIALGALRQPETESVLGTPLPEGFPSHVNFYARHQTGRGVMIPKGGASPLTVQMYGVDFHQLKVAGQTHPPVADQASISLGTSWSDLLQC